MKAKLFPGLFSCYGKATGRAWLRNMSPEVRKQFGRIGLMHACQATEYQFWSLGGKARARTAKRDTRPGHEGRFLPKEHQT
jgi:hypothetical protein